MRILLILVSFCFLSACGGSSDGIAAETPRGMSMPSAISAVPSN